MPTEAPQDAPEGASGLYSILGHKADLMFLHLRPTLDELSALERAFARTRLADYAPATYSYVSITELGLYEIQSRGVVENLAQNSIRYAGPGSTLTLAVRPHVLEVGDDGRGVEEVELPRLFERFYRSDRARASRGTGLGLAIVKHVVVSAGGEVEASGGPGRGLRVSCSFPAP